MRESLAAVAVMLSAAHAQAETVRVYSGEHADFSRIVLVFGDTVGWSTTRSPSGFEVSFDRKDIALDLGGVFDSMSTERIQGVDYNPATAVLSLKANCRCEIEVTEAGERTLAIDVKASSLAELPGEAVAAATPKLVAFPFGLSSAHVPITDSPLFQPPGPEPDERPALALEPKSEPSPRLAALETALLEQLARAVNEGVAEISLDATKTAPGTTASDQPDLSALEERKHIRSRTVYETEMSLDEKGPACYGEEMLDVATWAPPDDPSRAFADARIALVSEIDQPESDKVLNLVKVYLAFGFGAEADAVIEEIGADIEDVSLYRAMAKIVDNDKPPANAPLLSMTACDGPAALWALAAQKPESVPADVNTRAVQAWFLRLPAPLRQQLGPQVVKNLLASGNDGAAATVRSAIERTSEELSPRLKLMDAEAALEAGATRQALDELAEVASNASDLAPEALTKLLEGARRRDMLDKESIFTAEAVAFENRGTPAANDLLEQITLAWSKIGEFGAAWDAWERFKILSSPRPVPDEVFSTLVLDMVHAEAGGRIVRLAYSPDLPTSLQALTREATLGLADWLVKNGFSSKAQEVLAALPADDALDVRRIRAKVALASYEPSLALSFVAAEQDPESLKIRAEALSALGEHSASSVLFEAVSQPQDAAQEAWLGGEPGQIVAIGSDPERAFIQQFSGTQPTLPPTDVLQPRGPEPVPTPAQQDAAAQPQITETVPANPPVEVPITLKRSRELIEGSRSSRTLINDLLRDAGSKTDSPETTSTRK